MISVHSFLTAATSGCKNISLCVDCVVGETTSESASLSPISAHCAGTRRHTCGVAVSVWWGRTTVSQFSVTPSPVVELWLGWSLALTFLWNTSNAEVQTIFIG